MNIRRLTIATFMLLASTQVLAFQCPGDVKAVDAALASNLPIYGNKGGGR